MNRMHEFPSRVTTTDSHSFRVLLEKRKFLIETGPEREREESFIKYSSTGTANRSPNFFHRIPSNHCETSSKLPCPNTVHIISHRSMLISSKETKRNSRFFEFIFHCRWILKKHLFVEIYQLELHVDQRILSISTKFPLIDNRHCRSLWRYHPNYRGGDKKREYGFKFHTKLFNRILCGRRPLGALR